MNPEKPLILITGAGGALGSALVEALQPNYRIVGMERAGTKEGAIVMLEVDLGRDDSVEAAFARFASEYGTRIASVIHLAAYFDFTGEDNPLYTQVNVEGTRRLLRALQTFEVEQFLYSGTMLVHAPGKPGERIDEHQPIAPQWAYPRSKAAAEEVIQREHGKIPFVLLHLAGVYDEHRCVPTLAQQIARIYERDFKSHLYSGDPQAGQALLHQEDMVDAFRRAVDRRNELPADAVILIGEPHTLGYEELQNRIGRLLHGDDEWATLQVPKPLAALGAAIEEKIEPLVPDSLDHGEMPFIRPFMVRMADDHYALDISRARRLLGWEPRRRIDSGLRALTAALKADPLAWYEANGITAPDWMQAARGQGDDPEALRQQSEAKMRAQHAAFHWAPLTNMALGAWLLTGTAALGLQTELFVSDLVVGVALMLFAALALSWHNGWARWVCAVIGMWLLFAPLAFWARDAASYLNNTLVGMLVIGCAVATPPEPGVSPLAALRGPSSPPGWSFNPSDWLQRLPIILLAVIGLQISRYLTAYQLGHVDGVWDPFFAGIGTKNGTEEIITSSVSKAWPVPDAGVGALTYALEILTGIIGSRQRWRTMPWLVLLFGLMIVPLGAVSIFFIIIQPIWIGTWCALCLIAAAAMLIQIPYSLDEILATVQFLRRRARAGQSWLRVLMIGDTDEQATATAPAEPATARTRPALLDMWGDGVNLPWNLAVSALIGVALMASPLVIDAEGSLAHAHHVIGSLVVTVSVIACAEVARKLRLANALLGITLLVTSLIWADGILQHAVSLLFAIALIALCWPRGRVSGQYGGWNP